MCFKLWYEHYSHKYLAAHKVWKYINGFSILKRVVGLHETKKIPRFGMVPVTCEKDYLKIRLFKISDRQVRWDQRLDTLEGEELIFWRVLLVLCFTKPSQLVITSVI